MQLHYHAPQWHHKQWPQCLSCHQQDNLPMCPSDPIIFHVKGHQDSKSKQPLIVIEQFNVDCNRCTKQFVNDSTTSSTSFGNPKILAAQPHLQIGRKLLCRKLLPTLHQSMSMPDYHLYLQKKLTWMPSNAAQVHYSPAMFPGHVWHKWPVASGPIHQQQAPPLSLQGSPVQQITTLPMMPMGEQKPLAFYRKQKKNFF